MNPIVLHSHKLYPNNKDFSFPLMNYQQLKIIEVNLPIVIHPQTNIEYPGALRWSHQRDLCIQIHQHGQLWTHLNVFH
jgi:hypothetical protein